MQVILFISALDNWYRAKPMWSEDMNRDYVDDKTTSFLQDDKKIPKCSV
jgi:hypothetical protein